FESQDFYPMVVLDAVLTGAKGLNLWSSFRTPPPQRSARLYRALVDRRLASWVGGAMLPTRDPFLYSVSATATAGTPLGVLEEAAMAEIDRVARDGVTDEELSKAKNQLRARLVFENDSVTHIAHQLGYFETVATWRLVVSSRERIERTTLQEVNDAARLYLRSANQTVGWFEPLPPAAGAPAHGMASAGLPAPEPR
ncbi:MAG: insulinase family protein, partial [Acidobacteria bacterium]|nr:insulinase family protein [Acidobacteriota bacterium]